jgi:hypothetical protein
MFIAAALLITLVRANFEVIEEHTIHRCAFEEYPVFQGIHDGWFFYNVSMQMMRTPLGTGINRFPHSMTMVFDNELTLFEVMQPAHFQVGAVFVYCLPMRVFYGDDTFPSLEYWSVHDARLKPVSPPDTGCTADELLPAVCDVDTVSIMKMVTIISLFLALTAVNAGCMGFLLTYLSVFTPDDDLKALGYSRHLGVAVAMAAFIALYFTWKYCSDTLASMTEICKGYMTMDTASKAMSESAVLAITVTFSAISITAFTLFVGDRNTARKDNTNQKLVLLAATVITIGFQQVLLQVVLSKLDH